MTNAAFITLEGLEGVGKTTNRAFVEAWLNERGIAYTASREPGGTDIGEQLRELLLHQATTLQSETELLLMAASRVEHVAQVIEPALDAGRWVVCDRFLDASLAYQGGGRELGVERVAELHRLVGVTRTPDLTLLFDLDPELGRARAQQRGAPDRIEQEERAFFERARAAYRQIATAEPERVVMIDASDSIEAVQVHIAAALEALQHRINLEAHNS